MAIQKHLILNCCTKTIFALIMHFFVGIAKGAACDIYKLGCCVKGRNGRS